MGSAKTTIEPEIRDFILSQRMFFVASAPISGDGHVNLSPKGLDTLRILDDRTVAYFDFVGSGAETIAHLRENGRMTIMFCAFDGGPKILRLYGRGEAIEPHDPQFAALRDHFPPEFAGRAIIQLHVTRVAVSCGFGVPLYSYVGERSELTDWCDRKGADGLREYQEKKNATSLDGLPALRWIAGK